jgi:sugar lactone lactonase YvrE
MEHPNGMRIKDGFVYVTQSTLELVKHPSGKLVSCVYRFALDDENIEVTNTLEDKNILTTFVTQNPDDQYGVDGIEFDKNGDLLVGNFGDGAVYRIKFNEDLSVKSKEIWAQDKENLESTDGMIMDKDGNLYIADFCANAIVKILPDGTVTKLAQNGDTDGFNGELDQPGEPIIWNGSLVVSCFDTVVNDVVVNTKHELPATLAEIKL